MDTMPGTVIILSFWICEQDTCHILDASDRCNSLVRALGSLLSPSCGSQPCSVRKFPVVENESKDRVVGT